MTVTGNGDQAPLTAGEPSPLCQHIAHGAEVIFPFYDLLYLASVLALETVSILGISCIFPDCHFPLPCALLNILQYIIMSVLISQLVHPPLAPVCRALLYYSPYFTDDDPVMSDKLPQVTCLEPS